MRQTSVETYHRIENEGLLSRLRLQCYKLLYDHGPCTAGELMAKAKELNPDWSDRHVWSLEKRLSELKEVGTVSEIARRHCKISGRLCIEWDVTDGLPKPVVKISPKQIVYGLAEKIGVLEAQVAELRQLIQPKQGQQGYFFK